MVGKGLARAAKSNAIGRHDWDYVRKHFSFAANMLENAGAELRDALHVSYLGNLFYGETSLDYAKARILLPKPLAISLEKVERHYEDLYPDPAIRIRYADQVVRRFFK